MLLIHWSKHNNTGDILKNGIQSTRRKNKEYDVNQLKGVWCFPYTRNTTHNNNWKSNLKGWRKIDSNFNGFVFKLEEEDFSIYAGDWYLIGLNPEENKFETYSDFIATYGKQFSEKMLNHQESTFTETNYVDLFNFEIIIPRKIEARRIVKVLKDSDPRKKN